MHCGVSACAVLIFQPEALNLQQWSVLEIMQLRANDFPTILQPFSNDFAVLLRDQAINHLVWEQGCGESRSKR